MGLLDEAIREHLELKRLRGANPADVARMEREALGPARRPDSESESTPDAAPAVMDPFDDEPASRSIPELEEPAGYGTASGDYDPLEPDFEPRASVSGVYDDELDEAPASPPPPDDRSIAPASFGQETAEFDVESDLIGHRREPLTHGEVDEADEPPAPGPHAADVAAEPPLAPPPSPDEPGPYGEPIVGEPHDELEPTQLHEQVPPPPDAPVAPEGPHHPPPAPAGGQPESGEEDAEPEEDVLEETPDFLQETPEHERLWFEQRPPRDFDFDK